MDEILGMKKRINPTVTWSTATICIPPKQEVMEQTQPSNTSEFEGLTTNKPKDNGDSINMKHEV